MEDNLIF